MAYAFLLFVPLSVALRYIFDATPSWVFLTGAAAIAVLADWLRRATDQLAERTASTIGGLLNISFGNTDGLILALFILWQANIRVVQAQITGSIIGTTLLFLGIRPWSAGRRVRQTFSQPAPVCCRHCCSWWSSRFASGRVRPHRTGRRTRGEHLPDRRAAEPRRFGRSTAALRRNLIYTLVTYRDVLGGDAPNGQAEWSVARASAVMTAATVRPPVGRRLCAGSGHGLATCWG